MGDVGSIESPVPSHFDAAPLFPRRRRHAELMADSLGQPSLHFLVTRDGSRTAILRVGPDVMAAPVMVKDSRSTRDVVGGRGVSCRMPLAPLAGGGGGKRLATGCEKRLQGILGIVKCLSNRIRLCPQSGIER